MKTFKNIGLPTVWDRTKASGIAAVFVLSCAAITAGADWPQFRGLAGDGISAEAIATTWATTNPGFVTWTNTRLTNGFSSFAVSQGRAFTLLSRNIGGALQEVCAAVDATTGTNLWATAIDSAPWNPNSADLGGAGIAPCDTGDGPRTSPSVKDGRVFALSGHLNLVCMNATNGSVIWSNNLVAAYGASEPGGWENGASPRLDEDLIFVNCSTSANGLALFAFRTTNGTVRWQSQGESVTHSTPLVATINGVRQVIFATVNSLVSLHRDTGALLWKFPYPFYPVDTAMGAAPVVYSNIVFVTAAYGTRGAAAARITLSNSVWTVSQLWFKNNQGGVTYKSTWMTPVCYQGYLYGPFSDKGFTTTPLNCIELATGNLQWSTNNFGMGGIILVNTNLIGLTEDGQLILIRPNPSVYTELARYRAFQFSAAAHGKCWSSPAYSDGRLYVRSTRGGLSVNMAPLPLPPALQLLSAQRLNSAQLQLVVTTTNGVPIDPSRLPGIEVRATNTLGAPLGTWPRITNVLVLVTNGQARLTHLLSPGQPQLFYILREQL